MAVSLEVSLPVSKVSFEENLSREFSLESLDDKIFLELCCDPIQEIFKYLNIFYQNSKTFSKFWDLSKNHQMTIEHFNLDQIAMEIQWFYIIKYNIYEAFFQKNPDIPLENFDAIVKTLKHFLETPTNEPYLYLLIYISNISQVLKTFGIDMTFNELHDQILNELQKNTKIDLSYAKPYGMILDQKNLFFAVYDGQTSIDRLEHFIECLRYHSIDLLNIFYFLTIIKAISFSKYSSILTKDFFSKLLLFSQIHSDDSFLTWYKENRFQHLLLPSAITTSTPTEKAQETMDLYSKRHRNLSNRFATDETISPALFNLFLKKINFKNTKEIFSLLSPPALFSFIKICFHMSVNSDGSMKYSALNLH